MWKETIFIEFPCGYSPKILSTLSLAHITFLRTITYPTYPLPFGTFESMIFPFSRFGGILLWSFPSWHTLLPHRHLGPYSKSSRYRHPRDDWRMDIHLGQHDIPKKCWTQTPPKKIHSRIESTNFPPRNPDQTFQPCAMFHFREGRYPKNVGEKWKNVYLTASNYCNRIILG